MAQRSDRMMWGRLFDLGAQAEGPLQARIRQAIVGAILDGRLARGSPVPSSRLLAEELGVARNTVVLAYQQLMDDGFLVSRERSGYFVSGDLGPSFAGSAAAPSPHRNPPDWSRRIAVAPSIQRNIVKPADWQRHPYPFVYGQFDQTLFPMAEWRECSRRAVGALEVRGWAPDLIDGDDRLLVEQIRTHVLPRRGVWVTPAEIMVTLGAQQALFLLAELLFTAATRVGIEDPGYPDARNIFAIKTAELRALAIDEGGLAPAAEVGDCDYVYVTPSHQCPTTVTMPLRRREALLGLASKRDLVLIEDDYESEGYSLTPPTPALKSLDWDQRVIYVGSLSKVLAPGLRLGFIVAPPELIREARAMRRLMLRHPPANNQRTAALFLSLGHYDALARRLAHVLRDRADALRSALARHMPGFSALFGVGGSSVWLEAPAGLDGRALAAAAEKRGVLIETGDVFFMSEEPPLNRTRLGFSSIPVDRIEAGVRELAAAARELERG